MDLTFNLIEIPQEHIYILYVVHQYSVSEMQLYQCQNLNSQFIRGSSQPQEGLMMFEERAGTI